MTDPHGTGSRLRGLGNRNHELENILNVKSFQNKFTFSNLFLNRLLLMGKFENLKFHISLGKVKKNSLDPDSGVF